MSKIENLQLELSPDEKSILLHWDSADNVVEYQIFKKTNDDVFKQLTKTINDSYIDYDILPNTDYSYYIKALGENKSFTVSYNEKFQSFESFYDFHPAIYINKGFRLLSTDPSNNDLYEHFKGEYNNFYGTKYPSSIILQANPQEGDCIFNNIMFKSEVYNSDNIDLPKETINFIRCWNEYQDSTEKPLVVESNISRHFRAWKANIPREIKNEKPTLDKIRGHWAKIFLKFDNPNNRKLVLHDITLAYTSYPN